MTQQTGLVPLDGYQQLDSTGPNPSAVIALATEQANKLMEIVEAKHLFQDIRGKKYLTADAWETIGAFNSVHAVTESVDPVTDKDGNVIAYQARVNLMQHGIIIGSGVSMCGLDEFVTQGKQGMAKHRAAMSACQTWAASKAYRLNYSWVAVMAGFEPTPADEMDEDNAPPQASQRPSAPRNQAPRTQQALAPKTEARPAPAGEMLLSNIRTASDFNVYYQKKGWEVDDLMAVIKPPEGMTPGQAIKHWTKENGEDYRELAVQMEYYVANLKNAAPPEFAG